MESLTVVFVVIAAGLLVGRISLGGITLGSSAILFVALLAGHFGFHVPEGLGTLGLAVFVYSVGLSAGPTFFRGLRTSGRTMACLGGLIVLTGGLTTALLKYFWDLPHDLVGGLMAGALTSTPALGAISESVAAKEQVAVGFGVAYPVGITAVVLFVQLAMKLGRDPKPTNKKLLVGTAAEDEPIDRWAVEVVNPGIMEKRPSEVAVVADSRCQMPRIFDQERWRPTPPDYRFKPGNRVLLVGRQSEVHRVGETLGVLLGEEDAVLDADHERKQVIVTSPLYFGKTLQELRLRSRFGITVTRIRRHEIEFVPSSRTRLEFGDTLTIVGEAAALRELTAAVGHRPRTLNETDLFSVVIGIGLGIAMGNVSLDFGGASVKLGIAGGPLLVGLVMGHFRRLGPLRGALPPAAMLLMTEAGLAFFLADAGVHAGEHVAEVLIDQGLTLVLAAAAIVLAPMAVGFLAARYLFRLSLLECLGATCGGMTSTPGLAVLTGSTDSSRPVTSYVAAYPVALVLLTVAAPLLMRLLN